MPGKKIQPRWGQTPWTIHFQPKNAVRKLPRVADFVVIGGGFTGLAAAAWLRHFSPEQSVVVLEAVRVGAGASGRTGGMALAETAAGNQPGLGDVLAGLRHTLRTFEINCDLDLRGAQILQNHRVRAIQWRANPEVELAGPSGRTKIITAGKIIFATNALSLRNSGLQQGMHPRLTLAVLTAPVAEKLLEEIGLAARKPFYTVDFPYLWGRVRKDRSIVWGAGLVHSPDSNDLDAVNVDDPEPSRIFAQLEQKLATSRARTA